MAAIIRRTAPLAIILVLAAVYLAPLMKSPGAISLNDDWTQIFAFQAFLYDELVSEGNVPERAHHLGSGFPIGGHPEYPILSPLTLTVLVFGPITGTKLNVVLVVMLGLFGMWMLCTRTLKLDELPSAYATATLAVFGWLPHILFSGNYPEIYYMWFPLLAWLVAGTERFDGPLVGAAAVGATMLLDGHLNAVSCFLLLGVWALTGGRRHVERYVIFIVSTAGMAAFKLGPTLALLAVEDRSIDLYATQTIEVSPLVFSELVGTGADRLALGVAPWIAALGGLVVWRRTWPLLVALVLSIILWFGPQSPVDLFWVLSRFPILRSMDAPAKYFSFFIPFFVILLGAYGLQAIRGRYAAWAQAAVLLAATLPMVGGGRAVLGSVFTVADVPHTQRAFEQIDTAYFVEHLWTGPADQRPDLYLYYRRGVGILRWEDNFQLEPPTNPAWLVKPDGSLVNNPTYEGEVVVKQGKGAATLDAISADSLKVTLNIPRNGVLIVNQRYDPGWSCDPLEPFEHEGLLAVQVLAENTSISCNYRSTSMRFGGLISLITCSALFAFIVLRKRRLQKDSTLS